MTGALTLEFLIVAKERHHEIFILAINTVPNFAERGFHYFIATDLVVMAVLTTIAFRFRMTLRTGLFL